jgi:Tol biopolymer transport system component
MHGDGTHKRTVPTTIVGNDYAWSPDHTRVAFDESYLAGGVNHDAIRVLNVTTGASKRIAVDKAYLPSWSRDGKWLAVTLLKKVGSQEHQQGIGLLSVDGKTTRVLTTSPNDRGPAWSPDGREIAYDNGAYAATHPGHVALLARNVSTNAVRTVAVLPINGFGVGVPYWSPSGTQIAILVAVPHGDGEARIDLINANGSGSHWAEPSTPSGPVSNGVVGWLAR